MRKSIESDRLSIESPELRGCVNQPKLDINKSDKCLADTTDRHVTEPRRSPGTKELNIVAIESVEVIHRGVGEVESGSGLFKNILKGSSTMRHDGLLM
jgi:hypothetical protein